MNILVTGANGQLGHIIQDLSKIHSNNNYYFTDVDTLDITDLSSAKFYVSSNNIDLILNCAAYTNVDKAEENKDIAYLVNAEAPKILAQVAKQYNCKLIHISTDYVFEGNASSPYRESDSPNPVTVYGKSKLESEKSIMEINPENSIIIRTAWLYSEYGNNFVKTMMKLGSERDNLNVVYDQIGTPTYARDLGEAIFTIIEYPTWESGIYQFTNEGVTSWYDFTRLIHKFANINCKVNPIRSEEYQYKTPRPHYSVLDKSKIKRTFNIDIRDWDVALEDCISHLI